MVPTTNVFDFTVRKDRLGHKRSLKDPCRVLHARAAASASVTGRVGSLQPIGQPVNQSEDTAGD